jgi:hypothetical protein
MQFAGVDCRAGRPLEAHMNRDSGFPKVVLAILLVADLSGEQAETGLKLLQTIPLQGNTFHVQGIDLEQSRFWVTSVDKERRRGLLLEYTIPDGILVRSTELQQGSRYHPGGIMKDGESLWVPVAEYRRESSAVIQRRNKRTLKLESQFEVQDHIGAIAVTSDALVGANWDARELYIWDRAGKLIRKIPNPSAVAFQDLKFVNGKLVGSGLDATKSGAIVWMDWPSLNVVRTIWVGRTDRGVAYTHEGMTMRNGQLWLLPEDRPSRLFAFEMP